MKCADCKFFSGDRGEEGLCRRRAPIAQHYVVVKAARLLADIHHKLYDGEETAFSEGLNLESRTNNWSDWPVVNQTDWCGDFVAK